MRLCLHEHMMILEGIPPHLAKHQIDLNLGTIPIKQRRYQINLNYGITVKKKLDKLLAARIILHINAAYGSHLW